MTGFTEAEACARYLRRSGSASRLVHRPYGLHADLDAALAAFEDAGASFLESARQQLAQIDLDLRFHFGFIDDAVDAGRETSSRQEAYAVSDAFADAGTSPANFVLFTLPFARDICMAWDALLSRRELFQGIGDAGAELSAAALVSSGPVCPRRARYARDQALLTLEFALLHEFYHVASGHLDAVRRQHAAARLHAVTASGEQGSLDTRLYKTLELDADVMALRHQTMRVLKGDTLVPHERLLQSIDVERLRDVGRSATLLFRLIELWRRNVRLKYAANDFHPHPDVRDATLHAYMRQNADPDGVRSEEFADAYGLGQSDMIDALAQMNTLAPSFDIVEGLGQDLAVRETEWLIPELNRLRREGVGPRDFRRLAAARRG